MINKYKNGILSFIDKRNSILVQECDDLLKMEKGANRQLYKTQ